MRAPLIDSYMIDTFEKTQLRDVISNLNDFRAGLNIIQLVHVFEKALAVCEKNLRILGEPRNNEEDQRQDLTEVSIKFHELLKDALRGSYNDFEPPRAPESLRPQLRKTLESFEEHIRRYGCRYSVMSNLSWGYTNHIDFRFANRKPSEDIAGLPLYVEPEAIIKDISDRIEELKGQGLSASHVTNDLIHAQCSSWEPYARFFVSQAHYMVQNHVNKALKKCAPRHIEEAVQAQLIVPYFEARWNAMAQKVGELLRPYETMQLVKLNQVELDAALERWKRHRAGMQCMAVDAASSTALEVLDHAWAYYDVSL